MCGQSADGFSHRRLIYPASPDLASVTSLNQPVISTLSSNDVGFITSSHDDGSYAAEPLKNGSSRSRLGSLFPSCVLQRISYVEISATRVVDVDVDIAVALALAVAVADC